MSTHVYEYVATLAKHANLSRAARELCITQPALTKFINRLEENLGIALFDRSSSPIRLTYAGEKYLEKAQYILEIEKSLEKELLALSNAEAGKLTIGITGERGTAVLPYLIPEFHSLYPRVELSVREGSNDFLKNALINEELDIIIRNSYSQNPGITDVTVLSEDNVLLAVPKSNPVALAFDLTDNSPLTPYYLTPDYLENAPFIVLSQDQGLGKLARKLFEKHSISPRVVFETVRHETALRLASSGMGMTFTTAKAPQRVQLLNPMAYFSLDDPVISRRTVAQRKTSVPLTPLAQQFLTLYRKLINTTPALQMPTCHLLYKHML